MKTLLAAIIVCGLLTGCVVVVKKEYDKDGNEAGKKATVTTTNAPGQAARDASK